MRWFFKALMFLFPVSLLMFACSGVDVIKMAELDSTWKECRIPEGVMISWDVVSPERWRAIYVNPTDEARIKYRVQGKCYVRDANQIFHVGLYAEKKLSGKGFVARRTLVAEFVATYARRGNKWDIDVKERKIVRLQDGFTAKVGYLVVTMEGKSSTGNLITKIEKVAVAFITDNTTPNIRYVISSFPNTNLPAKSTRTAWDVLDEFLESFRRTEVVTMLQ